MNEKINAVIYARFSSHNQQEQSVDGQVRYCTQYAETHNMRIIGTYVDRAMSGTNDNRPDFQKMIKDSENKQFQVVLVWKFDRFARNRYDSAFYRRALKITVLLLHQRRKAWVKALRLSFLRLYLTPWRTLTLSNWLRMLSVE